MQNTELDYVLANLRATKGRWPQVAKESGVSSRTFEKIVNGETANPQWRTVSALHAYFRRAARRRPRT